MKLDIIGRRFFKNIYPRMQADYEKLNYRIYAYPKMYPYSWVVKAKRGEKFNWQD